MSMSRYAFPTALCAFVFATPAMAEKLEITGEIITSTCVVNTTGGAVTVPMGRVDLAAVNAAERAGQKNFTINLDCTGSGSAQQVGVRFGGLPDGSTGNLALTASTATNVGVALYDVQGVHQKIGDDPSAASLVTIPANGTESLRFSAWYASPGKNATAGTANATADFVVIYQ